MGSSLNTTLNDICYKPMEPDADACTVQSVLGWWFGREDYLLKSTPAPSGIDYNYTYLDHAIYCSKYAAECAMLMRPFS